MKMLGRRRAVSGPLLVLLGAAGFFFYRSLVDTSRSPNREPKKPPLPRDGRELSTALHSPQSDEQVRRRTALVIARRETSVSEVQLYRRVLTRLGFRVQTSTHRHQHEERQWSLLVCVSPADGNCPGKTTLLHLKAHQRVNLLPGLVEALSAVLAGFPNGSWPSPAQSFATDSGGAPSPPPGPVAVVRVFVLVTSPMPLSCFLHTMAAVTANGTSRGAQISRFLLPDALEQTKKVVGHVLEAAVSGNEKAAKGNRCVLCYQLLTFTLTFNGKITPLVTQVESGLSLEALSDELFDRQVTRDGILEDTLDFLLSSEAAHDDSRDIFQEMSAVGMSQENITILQNLHRHMRTPSSFQLVCPSLSRSCGSTSALFDVFLAIVNLHKNSRGNRPDAPTPGRRTGGCVEPRLRQIYFAPPIALRPAFSPLVTEYHADVAFDTLVLRMRAETISKACHAHPQVWVVPVGLGPGRVDIMLTDADASSSSSSPAPRTLAVYTIHLQREAPPSLPIFGNHVTCGFLQDCGLVLDPARPCGLEAFSGSRAPLQACASGHVTGRWLVPCLSCSDNRTCDWREVTWQPDGCRHQLADVARLRDCMAGRKVLFLGDSTNRGMMYFVTERLNGSLAVWDRSHGTLLYDNVNGGRTRMAFSYYPQFWLEQGRRPTLGQALTRLLHRSRPLVNSKRTVLVIGGVQWLTSNHLQTVREVLDRESLAGVQVVIKSLGMGFHLPADGVRARAPEDFQKLYRDNSRIVAAARHLGYEVIDTLAVTMGRYKEFLQGPCACHFHQVEKHLSQSGRSSWSYHVSGPVNQIYSEILLSRLCPTT